MKGKQAGQCDQCGINEQIGNQARHESPCDTAENGGNQQNSGHECQIEKGRIVSVRKTKIQCTEDRHQEHHDMKAGHGPHEKLFCGNGIFHS